MFGLVMSIVNPNRLPFKVSNSELGNKVSFNPETAEMNRIPIERYVLSSSLKVVRAGAVPATGRRTSSGWQPCFPSKDKAANTS